MSGRVAAACVAATRPGASTAAFRISSRRSSPAFGRTGDVKCSLLTTGLTNESGCRSGGGLWSRLCLVVRRRGPALASAPLSLLWRAGGNRRRHGLHLSGGNGCQWFPDKRGTMTALATGYGAGALLMGPIAARQIVSIGACPPRFLSSELPISSGRSWPHSFRESPHRLEA